MQHLVDVCHIVWAYVRGSKKFEDALWLTRRNTSAHTYYVLNVVVLSQWISAYSQRSAGKIGSFAFRPSTSLKVLDSIGYLWLIVIHSDCGPISCRLRNKWAISV